MRYRRTLMLSLVVALLLAALPQVAAQKVLEHGRGHFHADFTWRSPSNKGTAAGLFFHEHADAGFANRVLVEDPSGRTLRLTKTIDPRRAIEHGELLDDATGWWAVLDFGFGLPAESLGAYWAARDELTPDSGTTVRMTLRTSDGLRFDHPLALAEPAERHRAFADALVRKGFAVELAQALPEGLSEAVLFLDASLSPNPPQTGVINDGLAYLTRGVVEVLAHALRSAASDKAKSTVPAESWTMVVGDLQGGRLKPYQLQFVSRFRSVENVDPLSDLRLDEVLPPFGP